MQWWKFLALSVATLVIVDACADNAARDLGRMMVDAGQALGGRAAPLHGSDSGAVYDRDAAARGTGGNGSPIAGRDAGHGAGPDGGMLADAGQMLVDAGRVLIDAGNEQMPDAQADAPLRATNGSRIKLRRNIHSGADGTRYEEPFLSYFDSMLGVTCYPYTTTDGKQRCIPQPGVSATYLSGGQFADTGCTSRVVNVAASCEAAAFAYDYGSNVTAQCENGGGDISRSPFRMYRLGARYTEPQYVKDSQGTCKATSATTGNFYVVDAEMQPNEFVEFTSSAVDVP